jgi:hypothetical protein
MWLALQALSAVRHATDLPAAGLTAAGVVVAGLALAAAVRTASWAWRGPPIGAFPKDDLVVCGPREADAVRAAARLRGTLGGAGHVYRARLALPVMAWAFAAAASLAGPDVGDAGPWMALLGASASASVIFPARSFFYREATGGGVVLHPASARVELLRSEPDRAIVERERGAP